MKNEVKIHEVDPSLNNRRSFLKLSGLALAGAGLVIAGCSNNDDDNQPEDTSLPGVRNGVFDLEVRLLKQL